MSTPTEICTARPSLVEALAVVPDPRRQCKNLRHALVDVLVIGFCGVLCGCEDFVEIEEFGLAKEDFFRRFLELPRSVLAEAGLCLDPPDR